jgi:hypothetical protein
MDNILKCCIVRKFGYQSLYVEGLDITIRSFRSLRINQRKIKNVRKVLNRIRENGIMRVSKAEPIPKLGVRWFEISQEDVMELLDCQGYEIKGQGYNTKK